MHVVGLTGEVAHEVEVAVPSEKKKRKSIHLSIHQLVLCCWEGLDLSHRVLSACIVYGCSRVVLFCGVPGASRCPKIYS